eukprot:5709392-Pyramimonas_sp.AAC.1
MQCSRVHNCMQRNARDRASHERQRVCDQLRRESSTAAVRLEAYRVHSTARAWMRSYRKGRISANARSGVGWSEKLNFCGGACPTYYLRPSNGRSSPGFGCPESLCSRVRLDGVGSAPLYHSRNQMGAHPECIECRAVMPKPRQS